MAIENNVIIVISGIILNGNMADFTIFFLGFILSQTFPAQSIPAPRVCLEENAPQRPTTRWTRWLNSDQTTSSSLDEGDNETISHILEVYGSNICSFPLAIYCQHTATGKSWTSTGLHLSVPCTLEGGLLCLNSEQQTGNFCGDFQIRLKCMLTYTSADQPAPMYHWDFSTRRTMFGDCPTSGDIFDIYPNQGNHYGVIVAGNFDATQLQVPHPGSTSPCVWPFTSDGTTRIGFGDFTGTCLSNPTCCQDGFTISVWLRILSTGADKGFVLSSGAHDLEGSYGVSVYVSEADTSPTIHVQMSIDDGLLATQLSVSKDEWHLLIASYYGGTLELHINNAVNVTDLRDVVPRISPILFTESFAKLEVGPVGGGTGPAFAIGDLQVYNSHFTPEQIESLKSYYEVDHSPECKYYHTGNEVTNLDPASYQHHYYWPAIPDGVTSFTFKVRANNDANIGLSTINSDIQDMYQILLGGWKNTKSVVRLCKECNDAMTPLATPGLLSPDEFRAFYITFDGQQISVGIVGQEPFMTLQHDTPFNVKHVGINSGHGSIADWMFCGYGYGICDDAGEISTCYAIDASIYLGISPGDYTPEDLTRTSCKNLCGFLDFTFVVVAGSSCFCSNTVLPNQLITDNDQCTWPCPGDENEKCGNAAYAIQIKSCSETVTFELDEVDKSELVGQPVAVIVEAESRLVPIAFDYGDETPTVRQSLQQMRSHVYAIPGQYVMSAYSINNGEVNSKALGINAVSGVRDIALTCPDFVFESGKEFQCTLEVFTGSDLVVDLMVDNNILTSIHVGSPHMYAIGRVTHDKSTPLQYDAHTPNIIIMPSTEVLETGYLVALEAFVYGDTTQTIEIHVMKPTCDAFPGTIYCQETNTCKLPGTCALFQTEWHTSSASRRICGDGQILCIHTGSCIFINNGTCANEPERYPTASNSIFAPLFDLVHRIRLEPSGIGYNYFDKYNVVSNPTLIAPLLMEVGYVLAFVEPAAGIHIAYEVPGGNEPSEISITDGSKIQKRHFLRAILSQPIITKLNVSVEEAGIHVVTAVVNSLSAEGGVVQTLVELTEDIISGLAIDINPKLVLAQEETISVKIWLELGNGVFFTCVWGDGLNDTIPRQASNSSQYDECTHIYEGVEGNFTIEVTAWNDNGVSVNQSGKILVVYPVQRHQYSVMINSSDLIIPYKYPKTDVQFVVLHTYNLSEIVASNTYATLASYNSVKIAGPVDLNHVGSSGMLTIHFDVTLPGLHDMFLTVSNGHSHEIYNISVEVVEGIANYSCRPMYQPPSVTGDILPGKGEFMNAFPVDLPVLFVNSVDAGNDILYRVSGLHGSEYASFETTISHQFSQPGIYDVHCYAENPLGKTELVEFDVIMTETIKGITVTDLGLTKANQPRLFQINITNSGTNSSLMIDFGDGSNATVFGFTDPHSNAIWEGFFDFTWTVVSHIYKTNGTFYVRVYGWNLVSDFEVITLIIESEYDCGTPSLTIRDGNPDWRQPRHIYRQDSVVIEAVTDLTRQCIIHQVIRKWVVQQLDVTTGDDMFAEIILTDLAISDPKYIQNANTSEIRIPSFYPIEFGLFRFTHKVNVQFSNGEAFDLAAHEYVYMKPGQIQVAIVVGDSTTVTKGRGQKLFLQPGDLSVDPDQGPAEDKSFDSVKYFCRRIGEPWPLVYGGSIDKDPIQEEPDPSSPLYMTGCFGTGPGRLNHTGSSYYLDTGKMNIGFSYEILVMISKGDRQGTASITVTVVEGANIPEPVITCNSGTTCVYEKDVQIINPSSDFRLEAGCRDNCVITTFEWTLTFKSGDHFIEPLGWLDYATGTNTSSLFLSKDVFSLIPQGSEINFVAKATAPDGAVGTSQMKASLNLPPNPGVCTIMPTAISVFETIVIMCSDWTDVHGIAQYEFYVESSSSIIKVLTFGKSSQVKVAPPVGLAEENFTWKVFVKVVDSLSASTTHMIGLITVNLLDGVEAELFGITDGELGRKALYDELIIEDNSHAINWQTLQDASILNELRYIDALTSTVDSTTRMHGLFSTPTSATSDQHTLSNTTITSQTVTTARMLSSSQTKELARVTRAYVRKDLATLLSTSSMDSMTDILLVSGATSVLTAATDELSHNTLATLGGIASSMAKKYEQLSASVDQDEVYRVGANILDSITNIYKGSYESITNPMTAMDTLEDRSDQDYSDLVQLVGGANYKGSDTTTDIGKPEFLPDKISQAAKLVKDLDNTFEKLKQSLAANKVPGEPPYSLTNINGLSLTVQRGIASSLTDRTYNEGAGSVSVPSRSNLFGDSLDTGNEVIDVMPYSMDFNPYNFGSTSDKISKDSHVIGLSFYTRNQQNQLVIRPVQKTSQNIVIKIPRPKTQVPVWNLFYPIPHDDTGMCYHVMNMTYNDTSLTVQIQPDKTGVRYAVFLKWKIPPTVDDYDLFVMQETSTDVNASNNVFTVFVNNTYIANNLGQYFIGIVELQMTSTSGDYNEKDLALGEFKSNYSLRVFTSGCSFWLETEQTWLSQGCVVDSLTDHRYTYCLCDHLTSFASTWIVPPTPLDFDYIFANADFADNVTMYSATIAIYVIFILLFIWARRADVKDLMQLGVAPLPDNNIADEYHYEIVVVTGQRRYSGTKSRVSFIVSGDRDETPVRVFKDDKRRIFHRGKTDRFLMSVSRPLGTLNYVRIWHDNSGKGDDQSWFLSYVAIRDIQTKERFYFIINQWFSVVDGDGEIDRLVAVAGKEQMQGFSHVFTSHTVSKLNDGHLWFSVFNRPPSTRFTRVQRVACCMMILWLEMMVNIMWYTVQPPADAARKFNIGPFSVSPAQISIGVQANLIVFPVSFLVVNLFRKARARHKRPSRIDIAKRHQKHETESNIVNKNMEENNITSHRRSIIVTPNSTNNDLRSTGDHQQLVLSTTEKENSCCYVRWWMIYIAWILTISAVLSSTIITVFYGIQFGNETTKKWFTSVTIAFCTGVLITQPLQAIAIGLFVALIIKTPNADEDGSTEQDEEEYKLKSDEELLHSYNDLDETRRPLKSAYLPPDPALVETQRLKRQQELLMHAVVREMLIYIFFLFIVMIIGYSSQSTQAYFIKESYTNMLVYSDDFKATGVHNSFVHATSVEKYWAWLETKLIPQLYGGRWYNGYIDETLQGYTGDMVSYVLGHAIIRQLRIKRDKCEPESLMRNVTPECAGSYSWSNEDQESYGPGWVEINDTNTREEYSYSSSSDLDGYPFVGRHATYRGGGYAVKLDGTIANSYATVQQLQDEGWIDSHTRAVFVQFSSYNAFVNLFSSVTLLMEFLPTGSGHPFYRVDVIKLINYSTTFFIFQVVCEVLFFLFIIFFFFKQLNNMRIEKSKFLKHPWNYIELFMSMFSIASVIAYIYRYTVTQNVLTSFRQTGGNTYINLQYVTHLNDIFHYMFGGVVFFATIKFLKLLNFNKRMHLLADTIYTVRWDLFSFAILFSFVFFAFTITFYIAFGPEMFDFADIVYTMETLLVALLHRFSFPELLLADRVLGPLMYFMFMSSMTYIVLNFLVTIVLESFGKARETAAGKSNEYEIVDFIILRLRSIIGLKKSASTEKDATDSTEIVDVQKTDTNGKQDIVDKKMKDSDNNLKQLTNKIDALNARLDHMMFDYRRRHKNKDEHKLTMKWYARRAYKKCNVPEC